MSTVGTLVFCSDCGNLLDSVAGSNRIECEMCSAITKGSLSHPFYDSDQAKLEEYTNRKAQTLAVKVLPRNPPPPPSRRLSG